MRTAKAKEVDRNRADKFDQALEAMAWAKHAFPTAAADESILFLEEKAAERMDVSRRQFRRYLGKK